jgi:hypothetical protein
VSGTRSPDHIGCAAVRARRLKGTSCPTTTHSSRTDFGGTLWDIDRSYQLVVEALSTDPLLGALTILPTARHAVSFPYADLSLADWVAELAQIPAMSIDDTAPVVAPAKLAGTFLLSSESLDDADFPVASFINSAINRSVVRKASHDVVYGVGGNAAAPVGFFSGLPAVPAATLRAGVIAAVSSIARNYGSATTVVVSPELWAAEADRREGLAVASSGPLTMFSDLGVETTMSASLAPADALVLDKTRAFLVLRRDIKIASSQFTTAAFNADATQVRVIARLAGAVPRPLEGGRSITVTPG